MRALSDATKVQRFIEALGRRARSGGCVYVVGGTTAVLCGWRATTIDVDLKMDPEPASAFETIAALEHELDLNVELASPDQFVPAVPGWRERSVFIARHGQVDFFHYDPITQALAKIERGDARDVGDVRAMVARGLVDGADLLPRFDQIRGDLARYPALDPDAFESKVRAFVGAAVELALREMDGLDGLPAAMLVARGLADARVGRMSIEALLVATAAPRLSALGLMPYGPEGPVRDPELSLYALLGDSGAADPYSCYNALKRELSSFVHALEHRIERQRRLASVELVVGSFVGDVPPDA